MNSGTFGFVQLALDTYTNQEVAIKFLERGPGISKGVVREVRNHRLVSMHPHVVQFKEVFVTPRYLAIVMEYVAGGDLCDYFIEHNLVGSGLPEDLARWFFQQIVLALEFMHMKGVANRDLKLENTLVDRSISKQPLLKLCDFGYSKNELRESKPKTVVGTADYIAPEVLLYPEYDAKVSDVWSCGVMLYVLLAGKFPFFREGDEKLGPRSRLQQIFPRVVNADFTPPAHASVECRQLLAAMLTPEPARRATLMQIKSTAWFQKNLPAGALQLNGTLVHQPLPGSVQSEEEIMVVLQEAANAPLGIQPSTPSEAGA